MQYQELLDKIYAEVTPLFGQGKVADYIPALAAVSPRKFGMAICTVKGEMYSVGDAAELFSIQSVSKVFTLTLALKKVGDELWKRIGREPSGNPFNSLVQLEYENGIPRNPFINAGAQVLTDIIISHYPKPKTQIINMFRRQTGNPDINFDWAVAQSEAETGHRNRALVNFLKSYGNIDNHPQAVLDVYFHQCAIAMTCLDLCKAAAYLANGGVCPISKEEVISPRQTKRINSIMLTCGLYDAVGDFAYRVGLPGKSGVGGGIVAIVPYELCVAVWSPELNTSGNSLLGTKALELFTTYAGNSIF